MGKLSITLFMSPFNCFQVSPIRLNKVSNWSALRCQRRLKRLLLNILGISPSTCSNLRAFSYPPIVQRSNDGCGHHFRICPLGLRIISVMEGIQPIVTKALNCYNSGVHAFLRSVEVGERSTLPELHGHFPNSSQGGNLG
jgi:hypothetical protein